MGNKISISPSLEIGSFIIKNRKDLAIAHGKLFGMPRYYYPPIRALGASCGLSNFHDHFYILDLNNLTRYRGNIVSWFFKSFETSVLGEFVFNDESVELKIFGKSSADKLKTLIEALEIEIKSEIISNEEIKGWFYKSDLNEFKEIQA